MFNLKKSALAVLALTTSIASAGTMGPVCEPGDVTVPCESTGWGVGLTAMYVRPSYDADWAYIGSFVNANLLSQHRNESLDWGWGFKLEGSYFFGTGNDLNINWLHYDNTTNKSYLLGASLTRNQTPFSDKVRWDAVNVEFGQHVDLGERKDVRFFGGAQVAGIKSTAHATNFLGAGSTYRRDAKFSGFGPRSGLDATYNLPGGLGIYVNTAATLLVGTSEFTSSQSSDTTSNAYSASRSHMVPEVEGKIGGKYAFAAGEGTVLIDGGWMWTHYFNAMNTRLPTTASSAGLVETDFSYNGPYLGVKWVGNA